MTSGASASAPGGTAGIQSDPRQAGEGKDDGVDQDETQSKEDEEAEEAFVTKLWKSYDDARKFDENFRKQIAIDRRYAAGTSDLSWAVTTNLIGAFIDILVALLYARNPDVSVRKAPQVDESNTYQMQVFARTLEIVISGLWKRGKLKQAARRGVRSVLSNGEGWFKCTMVSEKRPAPEVETALNDAQETHARIVAQQKLIDDPQNQDPETLEVEKAEKEKLIEELQEKIELAVNKMFVIDYVETENIQVSTDINSIENYTDADWIGNELYLGKDDALARFPKLDVEDIKSAKIYYQRAPKEMTTRDIDNVLPQGMLTAESAQAFVTNTSTQESPAFVRVVEIWDRRDKQIRTIIDGVKCWAKEPYPPPYPTSRFFPYFYFAFYEVDGQRHAQSLSWRLYKLQDEYSSSRSNFRLTRERSIPGVLFNATMLDEIEAKKLTESKAQEYTALRPSDPSVPLANLFAPKPVQGIDMRLYDPTLILNDMERISGVQEALSAAINSPGNPKTATEANIQQSGTQARTTSDRDNLESLLTDPVLISDPKVADEFAAEIFWCGSPIFTSRFHAMRGMYDQLAREWLGKPVFASLPATTLLLDMAACVNAFKPRQGADTREGKQQRLIDGLGYRVTSDKVLFGCGSEYTQRLGASAEQFSNFQGLVWELIVPRVVPLELDEIADRIG